MRGRGMAGKARRQRGVAVVTALLLTTLAITIVGSLFWQQQVQVRSIENQRLQLQKQWILRGALDWARLILREDGRLAGTVDTLNEPWAVPLAETRLDQYVEDSAAGSDAGDAILSGSVLDAQSRYNLRNLVANGQIKPDEVAAFERLLAMLQVEPGLARATATLMLESEPRAAQSATGSGTQGGSGAQTGTQTGTQTGAQDGQPGGIQGGEGTGSGGLLRMVYVDDLLAVPGFTPEALEKVRNFVIILPRPTTVNINTAPAEVLAARIDTLSLAEANALVTARQTATFRNVADLRLLLPDKASKVKDEEVSVATRYFLVNGQVSMRRAGLEVQALIERDNTRTTLIWVKEN
ncbi:MAG: type II secretion system minor pseudopilin GspK [Noviherbaspirillum sp.]